jgi:hypothetical protein
MSFIIKLPLDVIIHYIGTAKQALTLHHIKPLGGPSWESSNKEMQDSNAFIQTD